LAAFLSAFKRRAEDLRSLSFVWVRWPSNGGENRYADKKEVYISSKEVIDAGALISPVLRTF
jgi:hypothetical protein